jgi:hypothetical protein
MEPIPGTGENWNSIPEGGLKSLINRNQNPNPSPFYLYIKKTEPNQNWFLEILKNRNRLFPLGTGQHWSKPAATSSPCKMDDVWTGNIFSLYSCPIAN